MEFLLVLVLVIGLVDWLMWQVSRKEVQLDGFRKVMAVAGFGVLPVLFLGGFAVFGKMVPEASNAATYNAFSTFLTVFLLIYLPKVVFLLVYGIGRLPDLPLWLKKTELRKPARIKKRHYPPISRAKFLSQVGIIMATAPFVALLFGVLKGRFAFYTRQIRMVFPHLPPAFDGLRIVQISDLHLGSFGTNREPMREAVDLINAEKPDMVFFTGDLVNNFAGEARGWEEILNKIQAPMGKYSILGNHDYGDYTTWPTPSRKEANFKSIVSA
ncbi:MAG: metallophosphoesterase, partial [Marinilabiliaceae bacterium]